jgi:hypothetical protein
MATKKSESLEFLKVGEAISQGLHDSLREPESKKPVIKKIGRTVSLTEEDLDGAVDLVSDLAAAVVAWWNKVWKALLPMLDRVAKDPRTPRLMHLARHGKNHRIRKKNIKRLVRIMKGD